MKIHVHDHVRGASAPVITVVEYGDYDCPHTRAAERVVRRLLEENPDVRLVFRHFPLTHLHPDAEARAALAESSRDFWSTHDRLMAGLVSETPDLEDAAMDEVRERKFDGKADYESLTRELRAAREAN